eukprot:TRINITY_DN4820_c1_g2_i1.p1 TRINITY_DN4820_c1_g2~~TRINITY_DN4820_c1_g2_i1.p1  ORF type:complete len:910 (+),score=189.10 TRINITY_DN4820_c1_g2_i1:93-2732(+)
MGAVCQRCCWALYAHMERPGDTDADRANRRSLFPVLCTGGAVSLGAVVINFTSPGLWLAGMLVSTAVSLIGVTSLLLRSQVSYFTITAIAGLGYVVGALAADVANAAVIGIRLWPAVVLVMDLLLVVGSSQGLQAFIIILTVAVFAAERLESAVLYGLYEAAGSNQDIDRPAICDCATPPCAIPGEWAFLTWIFSIFVFGLDYFVTRRFAIQLRNQLEVVDTAVRISVRVTEMLAAYATDDARRVVAQEGAAMPEELLESYEQLLDNLDSYRVYLPDSLLVRGPDMDSEDGHRIRQSRSLRSAPGVGMETAEVTISFTDIQSSTELWEAHPQGMYEGLATHNKLLREVYEACNGYEVKTIGDSFMVAFDSPSDGLRFGLEAQLGLLRQQWPDDLLRHPLCEPVRGAGGELLWSGLRIRIGVHSGSVHPEMNPVTGRCDYFGSPVNTAARLEAVLRKGGLVATSDAVVTALGTDGLEGIGSPEVHDAGSRELKGVKEHVKVWAIVPRSLAARLAVLCALSTPASPKDTSPKELSGPQLVLPLPGRGSPEPGIPPRSARCRGSQFSAAASETRSFRTNNSGSVRDDLHTSMRGGPRPERRGSAVTPTLLRLRTSNATAASARAELLSCMPVATTFPVFVSAAAIAADQTGGVVDGVLGSLVTVTWNATIACADHCGACRHYMAAGFRVPCNLGAASGTVLSGNASAGRRRFATVVGGCVDLAAALAEEAARCMDGALASGAVADQCAAAGAAFWAQLWNAPGQGTRVVWEVDQWKGLAKWAMIEEDAERIAREDIRKAQDGPLAALFRKACAAAADSGGAATKAVLDELDQSEWAGSIVAERLRQRIQDGHVRIRLLPPLSDGDGQLRADSLHSPVMALDT